MCNDVSGYCIEETGGQGCRGSQGGGKKEIQFDGDASSMQKVAAVKKPPLWFTGYLLISTKTPDFPPYLTTFFCICYH